VNTYTGIVKPQYRLLGMLMERRDLRARLVSQMIWYATPAQADLKRLEMERQLEMLDGEIRTHQSLVWQHYLTVGRSLDELRAFIGEDLMDELAAIIEPAMNELSS
jgi:hypothetical protein